MKNLIPKYQRPLKATFSESIVDVDSWYESVDAFDDKKFTESVKKLIKYINPVVYKQIPTDSNEFFIEKAQGTSKINFGIKKDNFIIECNFLKISENTNKIALYRKVAELNFSYLTLPQIYLENNNLTFHISIPLSLCQPYKLYEAFKEISLTADDYDDEFIEKYNAEYFEKPKVIELSEQEKKIIWDQIQEIFSEYKIYIQYFDEKRWEVSQWDIIIFTLFKIGNMPYVNGNLRTDLYEYITNIVNNRIDFKLRIDKGRTFIKQLMEKSEDEIMKNIYHADTFMTFKSRSNSKIIQEVALEYKEQIRKYNSSDDNFNVVYYIEYMLMRLLYFYSLDSKYKDLIEVTLEKASGKTYEEGAKILQETYEHFANETFPKNFNSQNNNQEKSKGFFAKLFGKN